MAELAGVEVSESEAGFWMRWRLGARVEDGLDWVVAESLSQGSVRGMVCERRRLLLMDGLT